MLLSASPREQAVCAIPIRPLQHFSSAIAATSKSPRLTSRFTAFESACTNGLPLELFGPASHLPFLLRIGPYVAESVMWRWPEQPPVRSNRTLAQRHISYRVPVSDDSGPSSPPPSTELPLAWQSTPGGPTNRLGSADRLPCPRSSSPATRAPATPGYFESVRSLCGVPNRESAEFWTSTGWRPHNQLGHIRSEARNATDASGDRVKSPIAVEVILVGTSPLSPPSAKGDESMGRRPTTTTRCRSDCRTAACRRSRSSSGARPWRAIPGRCPR